MILTGAVFVSLGLLIPSSQYEQILTGSVSGKLSWGPLLFRVLLVFHGLVLILAGRFWDRIQVSIPEKRALNLRIPRGIVWGMIGLTAAAFVLRFINLNSDLWVDEVYTLIDFVRESPGEIITNFSSQNQHMLFSLLAHASISTFGESAWAMRLPSVLFGAASLWALFFLARSIFDLRTAFLSAALMTVSYHHIWFSQNARGYMGLLFFTLLATLFWQQALKYDELKFWFGYALAVVLGMWIHMTMAFVVAAHGLVYLVCLALPKFGVSIEPLEKRAGLRPILVWTLCVTVTLQLYALALPEFLATALHEESKDSIWTNPLWVIRESLQNLRIGFAGFSVVAAAGGVVAFGWWNLLRKNPRMVMWMTLPPLLAGAFMISTAHNLFPRFFFFAMGFGILFAVSGAVELPDFLVEKLEILKSWKKLFHFAGGAAAILMIVVSLFTLPRNYLLPKQDFSGARQFVETNRKSGDDVVAVSIAGEMYRNYYAPQWKNAENYSDLIRSEKSFGDQWLVYTLAPEIKAFHPQMWELIKREYATVKIFPGTLNGGEIYVSRRQNKLENNNEPIRNEDQLEKASVQR